MKKYLLKIGIIATMVMSLATTVAFAEDLPIVTSDMDILISTQDNELSRGEFLNMLVNMFDIDVDISQAKQFSDVWDDSYAVSVLKAKAYGIINGVGDNKFIPEEKITNQDMYTIIVRALWKMDTNLTVPNLLLTYLDANQIADYAKDPIRVLTDKKFISGDKVEPLNYVLLSEAKKLLKDICINTQQIILPKLNKTNEMSNILKSHNSIKAYVNFQDEKLMDYTWNISGVPYSDFMYYIQYTDGYEIFIDKNNYVQITENDDIITTTLSTEEYRKVFSKELNNITFHFIEDEQIISAQVVNGILVIKLLTNNLQGDMYNDIKNNYNASNDSKFKNIYYINADTFEILGVEVYIVDNDEEIQVCKCIIEYDKELSLSEEMTNVIKSN